MNFKKTILIIFTLTISSNIFSQFCYQPTNGPYGGNCRILKNINNEVYAATYCGIYSTTNNGTTWKNKTAGLLGQCHEIVDIDIVNNKMITISADSGIYLSNDYGDNWYRSNSGIPSEPFGITPYFYDILVNGNDIFIGSNSGIYKSTNQGVSWSPSNIGLVSSNILRFTKNGNNLFLATNEDLYKSTNNGFTWTPLNTNFGIQGFGLISQNNVLYATGTLGIYKSTDDGSNWSLVNFNFGTPTTQLYCTSNELFCASNGSTYKSSNGGNSWTLVTNKTFSNIIESNNKLMGGNINGVYSWINGSQSLSNAGLGAASLTNALFADGNTLFSCSSNGFYRSMDSGNSWQNLSSTLPLNVFVKCMTKISNKLIIGTKGQGTFVSIDNGNTWVQSNNGLTNNGIYYSDITSIYEFNGRIFIGAKENIVFYNYANLFVSDDLGVTWNLTGNGLGINYNITSFCESGSYLFIGTFDEFIPSSFIDGVYLSIDNGNSWLFDGISVPIVSMCSNGSTLYAATTNSIHSSNDFGNTWNLDYTVPVSTSLAFITNINNQIIALGSNGSFKLNNGIWQFWDGEPDPNVMIGCSGGNSLVQNANGELFISPREGYSNTENTIHLFANSYYSVKCGVSKYNNNPVSNLNRIEIDNSISLFPNPTSSEITITSDKFTNEPYTLFDQMGRTVGSGTLAGTSTTISLSSLSKGIYILKVEGAYESAIVVKE
jgi:photosystem II stability/assembly factor-like uncharacterized protein